MPKTRFDDPKTMLMEAMLDKLGGLHPKAPGAIERSEAAGQTTLVLNTMIPKDLGHDGLTQADLEKLGFADFTDDQGFPDLFWTATLPEGWTMETTDHSMWSEIRDGHSRKRFGVFYKAAPYDRRAHMYADDRYSLRSPQPHGISEDEGYSMPYDDMCKLPHKISFTDHDDAVLWESSIYPDRKAAHDARKTFSAAWDALKGSHAWLRWWDADITPEEIAKFTA